MVYQPRVTYDAGPAECVKTVNRVPATKGSEKSMMRKVLICAVIALVLVPASVMAAGFGPKNTGAAPGQGQCLQDGVNCVNQPGTQGQVSLAQYRYGAQQNTVTGVKGQGIGQGSGSLNQTRSMLRLRDGSCGGCTGTPVATT